MDKPSITYTIENDLEPEMQLRVEIDWDEDRNAYRISYEKGMYPVKSGNFFDGIHELDDIVDHTLTLGLPVWAEGEIGLDGAIFRLTIKRHFETIELSWWCDIPSEWAEMEPLTDKIMDLIEREARYP